MGTRSLTGLLISLCALVFAPGVLANGVVGAGDSSSYASCRAMCTEANYGFVGNPAYAQINAKAGRSYGSGEFAFIEYWSPGNPFGPIQGFWGGASVYNLVLNNKFRAFICRSGGPQQVCDPASIQWITTGGNYVLGFTNPDSASMRIGIQYSGGTATLGSAEVSDASGNRVGLRANMGWWVEDDQAPTVTLDFGRDGTSFSADDATNGLLDVSADFDDNTIDAGLSKSMKVDGIDVDPNQVQRLPDGQHTITAHACDLAFPVPNCTDTSRTITFDSAPPAITIDKQGPFTQTSKPTIHIKASDQVVNGYASGLNLATAKAYLNGTVIAGQIKKAADGFDFTPDAALADDDYTFTFAVSDQAGNSAGPDGDTASPEMEFAVDLASPSFSDATPADGAQAVDPGADISVQADDAHLRDAALFLDNVQVASAASDGALAYADQSDEGLCPGSHQLRAVANDAMGHRSELVWSFSVAGKPSGKCAENFASKLRKPLIVLQSPVAGGVRKLSRGRRSVTVRGFVVAPDIKRVLVEVKRSKKGRWRKLARAKVTGLGFHVKVHLKPKRSVWLRASYKRGKKRVRSAVLPVRVR